MILCDQGLRVGLVTGHLPIKDVAQALNKELIKSKIELFNKTLKQDFGIDKPKIAVLGLNPHAGDEGLLGMEEQEIISQQLKTHLIKVLLLLVLIQQMVCLALRLFQNLMESWRCIMTRGWLLLRQWRFIMV